MAEVSNQRTSPWIAFLAGAVVMLAIVLIAFAWWRGEQAAQGVTLALRNAPDLPPLPRMPPDAPRLPGAPIPKPK
jgi:hypothetical protein